MDITERILSTLSPIGLSDMDSHALMKRIDTKYIFSGVDLPVLLEGIREEYRVLSIDSARLFRYQTLYFDTPDHECYIQHHNGKLNRKKYRIRQYQSSGVCFLEVKAKNNKRQTVKTRTPIDGIQEELSSGSMAFIESVTGRRPELIPTLWTRFSRITVVNRNLPERVTIDLDLSFSTGKDEGQLPGLVIAEVKQEKDNRHTLIREQLRRQHIRPMRMSKYCIGTAILKPDLKSNRFKPKLLAIRKLT